MPHKALSNTSYIPWDLFPNIREVTKNLPLQCNSQKQAFSQAATTSMEHPRDPTKFLTGQ